MTSSRFCRASLAILLLFSGGTVLADDLAKTIKTHLRQQTGTEQRGLVVTINPSAAQLSRANLCRRLEAFDAPGHQLAARVYVGARCLDAHRWRMWIPVRIQRFGPHAVTARALPLGQKISEADLTIVEGDLALLPADAVLETSRLLGMELRQAVPGGSFIRFRQVRRPLVIHRGEFVSVSIKGKGYQVSSRGVAINEAGLGERTSVRMASGATLTGYGIGVGHVEVK